VKTGRLPCGVTLQEDRRTFRMKKQQRGGVKTKCASSRTAAAEWAAIDWRKCECRVRKLQARIVKAQKEGQWSKVKALQHLLVTSFHAKALAVKRVTSNKGKRTAGVDKVKWTTPASKFRAVKSLSVGDTSPNLLRECLLKRATGNNVRWGYPPCRTERCRHYTCQLLNR